MTEYTVYLVERIDPEGGNHQRVQTKYWCDVNDHSYKPKLGDTEIDVPLHPWTDDNPYRLMGKIAKEFRTGDTIKTISHATIEDKFDGKQIEIHHPLSRDELSILGKQVLEELITKK